MLPPDARCLPAHGGVGQDGHGAGEIADLARERHERLQDLEATPYQLQLATDSVEPLDDDVELSLLQLNPPVPGPSEAADSTARRPAETERRAAKT